MKNGKSYGPFKWRFIKINLLFQFMHDRGITQLKAKIQTVNEPELPCSALDGTMILGQF